MSPSEKLTGESDIWLPSITQLLPPWYDSFGITVMSPLSCVVTLCFFHQVAGWLGSLLFADSHRDFLLPGLIVWLVWLWPKCHPYQARLHLKHWRHLPHGVSVRSSLSCGGVGTQGREQVTQVVHRSGGLSAEHSVPVACTCDYTFVILRNFIKEKSKRNF